MNAILPSLKTFKPDSTELIHHLFSPQPGQTVLSLGLITPFALSASGHPEPPALGSLWSAIQQVLGKEDVFDEGWPKQRGELLVAGCCYPPKGHLMQPVAVHVQAGTLSKQLAVFGERRYGPGGHISSPRPFDRMPVTLAHAFGGAEVPANAQGKGADVTDGAELPNIEYPGQLIASASDHPAPACLGPLPPDGPQRAGHLGDFSEDWLKNRWPHLPAEVDPRFFQAAPEDQQIQGYWKGGEQILVRNMHPEHPDLHGQVPALRPRFFIHQTKPDGEPGFLELYVHADTLWLLPEQNLGLVIYRAAITVNLPEARDVNCFYAEFEPQDTPELPIEHYTERCLRLAAPEAFRNIPDLDTLQDEYADLSGQELLEKVREQKALFQQALESHDIDEASLQRQLQENPHTRRFAQIIAQRNGSLSGFLNEIEGLLALLTSEDALSHSPSPRPGLEALGPSRVQTAQEAPIAPIESGHTAALGDEHLASHNRQTVLAHMSQGRTCSGLDLSQANLAGLDLAGMDFSNAMLMGANLRGAQLQGATLEGANLQGATFDAANLAGGQLTQATLDQASFAGANLQGARLDGSDCNEANFSGADLTGASLHQTNLSRAWLQRVKAARVQATNADFSHANLEGADFQSASLDRADFSGTRLKQARFDHASCVAGNFTQADLTNTSLPRCDLSASQAGPGTIWSGANLQEAILDEICWMGATLDGATLVGIKAQQADFSDTSLTSVLMHGSDLRSAVFDRADLRHANLSRSNLMEASFIHTNLGHCALQASNLYAANFMNAILDEANLQDANLGATTLSL
ncbi:DUF2169 domain-containing protein [Castellaniella hirudinis]|uniref:DUF2169 domain-containing protein n=1 Tax=Castellaniella hirudinis TaxID=1144617 RepID=A0ABV8S3R4_9BURK